MPEAQGESCKQCRVAGRQSAQTASDSEHPRWPSSPVLQASVEMVLNASCKRVGLTGSKLIWLSMVVAAPESAPAASLAR